VEYSTQSEREDRMALKYCQSHKCHTYDTKDRKRGSKGNRKNQTRRRSGFWKITRTNDNERRKRVAKKKKISLE